MLKKFRRSFFIVGFLSFYSSLPTYANDFDDAMLQTSTADYKRLRPQPVEPHPKSIVPGIGASLIKQLYQATKNADHETAGTPAGAAKIPDVDLARLLNNAELKAVYYSRLAECAKK